MSFEWGKGRNQLKVSEELGHTSSACPLPPAPLTSGRMESGSEPQVPDGACEFKGQPPRSDSVWPMTDFWWNRVVLGVVFKNNDFRKKEKQGGREEGQREEKEGETGPLENSKASFIPNFKAKEGGLREGVL